MHFDINSTFYWYWYFDCRKFQLAQINLFHLLSISSNKQMWKMFHSIKVVVFDAWINPVPLNHGSPSNNHYFKSIYLAILLRVTNNAIDRSIRDLAKVRFLTIHILPIRLLTYTCQHCLPVYVPWKQTLGTRHCY